MAERTGFLYPFLDETVDDPAALLADLGRSAVAKWSESVELRAGTLVDLGVALRDAVAAVAERLRAGGRLLVFGNGGSATDAEAFAQNCVDATPRSIPALCLAAEPAVLTALANDIGVDAVFARQVAAHGRGRDTVVAFSTSGGSTNVLTALDRARTSGLLTLGIAGYGGGAMAAHVDHCLAVRSESVHRIQEAQTAIAEVFVAAVSRHLHDGEGGR